MASMGFIIIWHSTAWGPAVNSDSVEYIVSARNLLLGNGLGLFQASGDFAPLSLHPPLYSLILAGIGAAGFDIVSAIRGLNAVLFAATIFVLCYATVQASGSWILGLSLGCVILSSPQITQIFSFALAEPLFLFFGTLSLILLAMYIDSTDARYLHTSSIASALAFLSRYNGAAFLLAGSLLLLLLGRGSILNRIRKAGYFSAVGVLPMLAWLGWLRLQPVAASPRGFEFYTDGLWHQLNSFRVALVGNLADWLIPFGWSNSLSYRQLLVLFGLIALVVVFTVIVAHRIQIGDKSWRRIPRRKAALPLGFLGFFVSFVIVMAFSYLFARPRPDLNARLLMPAAYGFSVVVFSAAGLGLESRRSQRILVLILGLLASSLVFSHVPQVVHAATDLNANGSGFTGRRWKESATIAGIQGLADDTRLVTNEPAAVLFHTGAPSHEIAELVSREPLASFESFGSNPNDGVQRLFRNGQAVLVLFDTVYWQFWDIYGEEASDRLAGFTSQLELLYDFSDGSMYVYPLDEIQ
jgi:hypothetical protein